MCIRDRARVVDYRQYIQGEPSDVMVEKMHAAVGDYEYHRVIAIGGGAILDVAKLFALERMTPVLDLYDKKVQYRCHPCLLYTSRCV